MITRVLVTRTDGMGDVLLITPAIRAFKRAVPHARVTALVRESVAGLLVGNPDVDEVLAVPPGAGVSWMADRMRSGGHDAAVLFQVERAVAVAAWRAGIPVRIGPASRIWSVLLTERVWQHRSRWAKHEAEYNLELLAPLGVVDAGSGIVPPSMEEALSQGKAFLERQGVNGRAELAVIHPGGSGSAGSWPEACYAALVKALAATGLRIVLSGVEEDLVSRVAAGSGVDAVRLGRVPIPALAGVLKMSRLFIGNNTGPFHLAVAVGTPAIGLCPGRGGAWARRWGPFRPAGAALALEGQEALTVEEVLAEARRVIR